MDLSKRLNPKLISCELLQKEYGAAKYYNLHPKRATRFKVYFHLQHLGHLTLTTKSYNSQTVIRAMTKELWQAIQSKDKDLLAYRNMIL